MPDFSNKTVIVTGASTGIGRMTAIAFHEAGARLVVAARSTDELELLSASLGGPDLTLPVTTDVSDPDQCQALIDRTVAQFGGIDILINNAGMVVSANSSIYSRATWKGSSPSTTLASCIASGRLCLISNRAGA